MINISKCVDRVEIKIKPQDQYHLGICWTPLIEIYENTISAEFVDDLYVNDVATANKMKNRAFSTPTNEYANNN